MYILESFDKEIYERDLKAEAVAEGVREKLKGLIQRKLAEDNTVEEIAEWLEEDVDLIRELKNELE